MKEPPGILNFNRIILSLLFIAGFGVFNRLGANHVLGGEIQYSNVTASKYKFTFSVYRNCNECEFNSGNCTDITALDIYASPEVLNYSKKLGTIALSRVSRKDVTPLCASARSNCTGGSYPNGMEMWTFEGFVDFDTITKDYCKFEVAIRINSRKDVYGLFSGNGEVFYNYARINICGGVKNNSPEFRSPVFQQISDNQSFTYNILANDPDGDSLSYEIVTAGKGWNSNVSYPTGLNSAKPVAVYCPSGNCDLNRESTPISGIGIDPHTGWLGFTPVTMGQEGFLVVQVNEWRKLQNGWELVGVTRRDMQISVVSQTNYNPVISTSAVSYQACAGKDFMLDLSVNDPAGSGKKDSVSMKIYSDLQVFSYSKVQGSSINQFDAFYTVKISGSQIRKKPYYVTFVARDNHCPVNALYYQTIEINVTGIPDNQGVVEFVKCNQIHFYDQGSQKSNKHSWFLFKDKKLVDSRTATQGDFHVLSPGKYYITHQVIDQISGCEMEFYDSIVVPDFNLMTSAITWPDHTCKGTVLNLSADFTGGDEVFSYLWQDGVKTKTSSITVNHDTLLYVTVVDDNGCELFIQKQVNLFAEPVITVNDTSLCLPTMQYPLKLKNRIKVDIIPSVLDFNYSGNLGFLSVIDNEKYFNPTVSGLSQVSYLLNDSFGCEYFGVINFTVITPVPTGIVEPDKPMCSNDAEVDLNEATRCSLTGGVWTCLENTGAVVNDKFIPNKSGAGDFTIAFAKDLNGCLIQDSVVISVNQSPETRISTPNGRFFCENTIPTQLQATPSGGIWSNNLNLSGQGWFDPGAVTGVGSKLVEFRYLYSDKATGCASEDTVVFTVNKSPQIEVIAKTIVCEGTEVILNPNPKNVLKFTLMGDVYGFDIRRIDSKYILNTPNVDSDTRNSLTWNVKAEAGCRDSIIPFVIDVKVKPEIALDASYIEGCAPFNGELKMKRLNPGATITDFQWSDGSGFVTGNEVLPVSHSLDGTYGYFGRAMNGECASNEVYAEVVALPVPEVSFRIDPDGAVITSDYSFAEFYDETKCKVPYTVMWEFESGTPATSPKLHVGVDFPKDSGIYKIILRATTDKGCSSDAVRYIRVRPSLKILAPNAFTPDIKGPVQNEEFKISMDSVISLHLTIRNRWGEILFESTDLSKGWNGFANGKPAPAGNYIWELEATTVYGIYVRKAGAVLLIR